MALGDLGDGIKYHGDQGLNLSDPGKIRVDRYGLATCTAVFTCPVEKFASLVLAFGTPHPIAKGLGIERMEIDLKGPFATISAEYAGLLNASFENQAVYELVDGVAEEPIETHRKFTDFAGDPTAPLNGATFRSISTGLIVTSAKPAAAMGDYVFDSFSVYSAGTLNPFAKMERYLEPGQVTWRKTWHAIATPATLAGIGKIATAPEGPAPTLEDDATWLDMGITSNQRGLAYSLIHEWRGSGRRGWNTTVYGPDS